MFIASFPAGPWQTNCYVVADSAGAECWIVDPGMDSADGVAELVREHRLKPTAILLTHGHLDHTYAVAPLSGAYETTCWIHSADRGLLSDPYAAMGPDTETLIQRLTGGTATFAEPDDVRELGDGAELSLAGIDVTTVHAPGHTPGSVMFRTPYPDADVDSLLFAGDVLFAGSIGRTDLPGGDHAAMLDSLRRTVLPLPDEVVVLPGHGPQTTIGRERHSNPHLQL